MSFENDQTDTQHLHLVNNLDDVHSNLWQKQLTGPDILNSIELHPEFSGEVAYKELNDSRWMYLRRNSVDAEHSKVVDIGGTSYLVLPVNQRSIVAFMKLKMNVVQFDVC